MPMVPVPIPARASGRKFVVDIVPNYAKQRLAAGKVAFGLTIRFNRTVEVVRMAATSGYHYVMLDLQHSTMDFDTAAHLCSAALDAGVTPIVRVPSHQQHHAQRILDGGAQGIIVPDIATADEARQAVMNCKYPPIGNRSHMGPTIQIGWKKMPMTEYTRILNDNLLLIALVESQEGLENIDAICEVEGLDMISVGTNDLSMSLGIPGEYDNPKIIEAYKRIVAVAHKNGKFVRLGGVPDPDRIQRNTELGSRLVAVGNDTSLFLGALRDGIADLQKRLDPALL
jgi:2-keto-3-deoxy-L-rhamnonate aldolase RhmA